MTVIHLSACVLALLAGAIIIIRPKGTPAHRALGLTYVGATVIYCGSSFFMYPSTGHLTPFHAISVQNLALVSVGVAFPRLLRRRVSTWYVWHLRFMLYSYVSLAVTGLRFTFPYLPQGNRLVPVLAFVAIPLGSWVWIERRVLPAWRLRLGPGDKSVHASRLEA